MVYPPAVLFFYRYIWAPRANFLSISALKKKPFQNQLFMIVYVFNQVQPEKYNFNNRNDWKTIFFVYYYCIPNYSDVIFRLILSYEGQLLNDLSS